jgi:hypothetical protein
LILEFALQIFQRLRHRAGRIVSHSESRLKNASFPSLQDDGQVFIFRFPDVFSPHVVSLTEIDFPRLMLDFLYPPIKMVVTDETTREEVLNPVVAFFQLVPFARPYHMSYDSDFLVFKKHRRFHVALPFLLRTLIDNSFAHHVTN